MSYLIKRWSLLILVSFPLAGFAQKDTLIKKLDSLSRKKGNVGKVNKINPKDYNQATQLNFNSYFIGE